MGQAQLDIFREKMETQLAVRKKFVDEQMYEHQQRLEANRLRLELEHEQLVKEYELQNKWDNDNVQRQMLKAKKEQEMIEAKELRKHEMSLKKAQAKNEQEEKAL